MRGPTARYVLAQVPGWILATLVAWSLWRWVGVAPWTAAALFGVWVAKDIALYPWVKRSYASEPAEGRMLGESARAVTGIAPRGMVRVRGELWQAELVPGASPIPEGGLLRVLAIRGLLLTVEPEASCPPEPGAGAAGA